MVTTQIIELPADATLTSIQRKLTRATAPRVLLVLAGGSRSLANAAKLRLVARQARQQGLQVALVSTDHLTRRLARRAGLSVFARVQRGERSRRWRQPRPELPLPPLSGPRRAAPPSGSGYDRRSRPATLMRRDPPVLPDRSRPRWEPWLEVLRLLAFLAICLAGLGAVVLFVVPVATVTLVRPHRPLIVTVPVVAAVGVEDVDYQTGQVAARVVQTRVEGTGSVNTTGRRDAPADAATGAVVLINRLDREVQVPELTVVGTSTGVNVRFEITQAVTVPAGIGATTEGLIMAVDPGPQSNVPAFTINRIEGPLGLALRVINELPTEGGSAREVGVVSEADKDRVRAIVLDQLRRESYQRLGDMLREGEFVPPGSVETFLMAETFDRFSGEDADVLGVRLELVARGLAVDTLGADQLAERALKERVPAGLELLGDRVQFSHGSTSLLDEDNQTASFDVTAMATLEGDVDIAAVRRALRGLELGQALATLRSDFELGAEPELTLRPNWLDRVPWLPLRIHVRVLRG